MPTKNEKLARQLDDHVAEATKNLFDDDYLEVLEDLAGRIQSMIEAKEDELNDEEEKEDENGEEEGEEDEG